LRVHGQSAGTRQPDGQIGDLPVQPLAKKYFASVFAQITFLSATVPSHTEGRFAIVTDVRRDAMDAIGAADESGLLADGEVAWS
jgi:hypothetical protein